MGGTGTGEKAVGWVWLPMVTSGNHLLFWSEKEVVTSVRLTTVIWLPPNITLTVVPGADGYQW